MIRGNDPTEVFSAQAKFKSTMRDLVMHTARGDQFPKEVGAPPPIDLAAGAPGSGTLATEFGGSAIDSAAFVEENRRAKLQVVAMLHQQSFSPACTFEELLSPGRGP